MSHLTDRRARYAAALDPKDTLVLIGAGEPIPVPGGLDRIFPFTTHPHYYVLAEQECAGAVLAYDAKTGWSHFSPPVTDTTRMWEGDISYDGDPISELGAWLATRRGRPIAMLGVPLPGVIADPAHTATMEERILEARRVKDQAELSRIRDAARITATAFERAPALCAPGASEREIQIGLEHAMLVAGADETGYDSIVGVGPNAAVFHFSPGDRRAADTDCVLIDAGAMKDRYTSDISRVYPASGTFNDHQKLIYDAVLAAEVEGINACRAGAEFHDLHRQATLTIASKLVDGGLFKGDPDDLVERGVMANFLPHGLGHMVGLGVRDGSGPAIGRTPRTQPGGIQPRMDLPLQPGYVLTIEPGCYFVPAIVDDPNLRANLADAVDWAMLDEIRTHIAGVRIEDNVLVTDGDPDNLTSAIAK